MPMPCCNRCYSKYIQADGTLYPEFVKKEFGRNVIVEKRQVSNPFTRDNLPLLDKTYIIKGKKEEELCMCPCHVEGINCMH